MVDKTVTYVRLPAWLCWTCLADADAVETALLRIGSEERTTVADAIAAFTGLGFKRVRDAEGHNADRCVARRQRKAAAKAGGGPH